MRRAELGCEPRSDSNSRVLFPWYLPSILSKGPLGAPPLGRPGTRNSGGGGHSRQRPPRGRELGGHGRASRGKAGVWPSGSPQPDCFFDLLLTILVFHGNSGSSWPGRSVNSTAPPQGEPLCLSLCSNSHQRGDSVPGNPAIQREGAGGRHIVPSTSQLGAGPSPSIRERCPRVERWHRETS